jgi:hypothetical protein
MNYYKVYDKLRASVKEGIGLSDQKFDKTMKLIHKIQKKANK